MKRQNTSPLLVVTDPSVIAVEGVPDGKSGGNPVSVHHSCPKRRTDTGFPTKRRTDTGFPIGLLCGS